MLISFYDTSSVTKSSTARVCRGNRIAGAMQIESYNTMPSFFKEIIILLQSHSINKSINDLLIFTLTLEKKEISDRLYKFEISRNR